jgi:integrase
VRHFVKKGGKFYWQPSKTIAVLGLTSEALGSDEGQARSRATALNALADDLRRNAKTGGNGPIPGSVAKLFLDYRASEEFSDRKPRTQKDYVYYLGKIEADFGRFQVRNLTPKAIKDHYKRMVRDSGRTWGYHILAMWRTVLSWGVSENWIPSNPALAVSMKAPKKRTVVWTLAETEAYLAKAKELGWDSIVAMCRVFDSIGQSPVDVRTLPRRAYDGRCIDVTRAKTGNTDAPIPLFPEAIAALDEYLAKNPKLPEAPLFSNDRIGGMWNESTLQKKHRLIRDAAKLRKELQLQDFRTTAATEGGAASGTVDELRALQRHTTRSAGEHYVIPDSRFVEAIQEKRLAHRASNKTASKAES